MPRSPESFVRARKDSWARLHDLVDRAQKSRNAALSDDELHELGTLYRRASADLARAQTRYANTFAGQELVRSLNMLVLRAHAQIYSAPLPVPARGWHFFLYGFPQAFRAHWRAILLAAALLYGPALASYVAVWSNPQTASLLIPDEVSETVHKRAQTKQSTGWGANLNYEGVAASPETSAFIMRNNVKVSILAVALGFTAGIGTSLMLIQNGVMVGALAGVATNDRVDWLFWSVILPHGILELTAICIAGGAGFVIARSIYTPGDMPRRDALRLAGIEAGKLLIGVAAMLVLAGLTEGFITPSKLPPEIKYFYAGVTAVFMGLWFMAKPREERAPLAAPGR